MHHPSFFKNLKVYILYLDIWSTLSWFLYMVQGKGMIPLFRLWIFSFPSIICYKRLLFLNERCFWFPSWNIQLRWSGWLSLCSYHSTFGFYYILVVGCGIRNDGFYDLKILPRRIFWLSRFLLLLKKIIIENLIRIALTQITLIVLSS